MNLLSEGNVVDAILQNLAGVAQEQEQLVETDIEDPEQAAEDRYLFFFDYLLFPKTYASKVKWSLIDTI